MKIILKRNPIAKKRHRCRCIGKIGMAYDPQSSKEMKEIHNEILAQWNNIFNNPHSQLASEAQEIAHSDVLEVSFTFYLPVNKSDSIGLKNSKYWGLIEANEKPDFDNLLKLICDCGTSILWADDKIIVSGSFKKRFNEFPRTEIEIVPKKELTLDSLERFVLENISPTELKDFVNGAHKITRIDSESIDRMVESLEGKEKAKALTQVSQELIEFALKYASFLSKVKKIHDKIHPVL